MKLYIKYVLFIYILAISSFEYFFRITQLGIYILLPFVIIIFYKSRLKFDFRVITVLLPFFIAYLLQTLLYNSPFYYAFTLVFRLLIFYFVAKIIGADFIKIYLNTIKVISIVAISFYALENVTSIQNLMLDFSSNFTSFGREVGVATDYKPNFIIYSLQRENFGYIRNAGPFWEPGVFVIFLNIALFLNLFIKKIIFDKTNILFICCIITSFSTSGYIALLANITFFALAAKNLKIYYRTLLVLLLLISIPTISSLSFMKEKVKENIEDSDHSYSRFGAALVHWEIIQDYPLTGLPYKPDALEEYTDSITPNGITEMFATYGILGGIFYYIFLFKSAAFIMQLINYKGKGYMLFFIFIILIFSENMGNRPIYWLLLFLPQIGFERISYRTPIPAYNKPYN